MSKDKNTNFVWVSKEKRKNKSSIYNDRIKEKGRDPKKKTDSTIPKERILLWQRNQWPFHRRGPWCEEGNKWPFHRRGPWCKERKSMTIPSERALMWNKKINDHFIGEGLDVKHKKINDHSIGEGLDVKHKKINDHFIGEGLDVNIRKSMTIPSERALM